LPAATDPAGASRAACDRWLVGCVDCSGAEAVVMHAKLTIRYRQGALTAHALVAILEREGVRVIHWAAPHSRWGVDDDGGAVALGIMASGARDRIQAAVARFRHLAPRADVVIEPDP